MAEILFEVKPDALAVIRNVSIDSNYEEVRLALTEMMEPYRTMAVTEADITGAKADRARINKVSKNISDVRKAVEAEYNRPMADFKEKCKTLETICSEASGNIDRQVKAFEQREKDEKFARLRTYYEGLDFAEEREYLLWDDIINPRWGNKGYSEADAQADIMGALERTRRDLETVREMEQRDVPFLLEFYRGCRDIGAVIRKANDLKKRRESEAQRRREEEERKRFEAVRDAVQRRIEEDCEKIEGGAVVEASDPDAFAKAKPGDVVRFGGEDCAESGDEPVHALDFRVWVTAKQRDALAAWLKKNGIRFGRVPR